MKIFLCLFVVLVVSLICWKFVPVKDAVPPGVPIGVISASQDGGAAGSIVESKGAGLAVKSTNAGESGPSMLLAWSANTEADLAYYRIYKAAVEAGPFAQVWQGPETTWRDLTVVAGGTYFYQATASNTFGQESERSAVVSGTIPSPPAPPQNLTASPEWGLY